MMRHVVWHHVPSLASGVTVLNPACPPVLCHRRVRSSLDKRVWKQLLPWRGSRQQPPLQLSAVVALMPARVTEIAPPLLVVDHQTPKSPRRIESPTGTDCACSTRESASCGLNGARSCAGLWNSRMAWSVTRFGRVAKHQRTLPPSHITRECMWQQGRLQQG